MSKGKSAALPSELAAEIARRHQHKDGRMKHAADDIKPGLVLYFRALTVAQRDRYSNAKKDEGEIALDIMIAHAENEDGEKVFSRRDKAILLENLPYNIPDAILAKLWKFVPPHLDPED